jgi:hypothetical protein
LTYGALSVNGDAIFKDRFGTSFPAAAQFHSTISRRWRKPCRRAMSRLLSSNRLRAKASICWTISIFAAFRPCADSIADEIQSGFGHSSRETLGRRRAVFGGSTAIG